MPANSPAESIFDDARRLADPAERRAYLDRACDGNHELRARIDRLLSAYDEGEFLESPPAMLAAAAVLPIGEQPGDAIGPYKLLEQIGEGGMGLVFVAEQTRPLRRRVALKIIKPGLDTRAVIGRFEAERQALALMDHPNIARVYDAGATDSGRPYFVMELVRGAPITDYCQQRQIPLRQRLELFIQVCHAVQHAHQKGVIHRDLKPTNILVSQSDTAPVPKVIDFGVAKATTQPLAEQTVYTAFSQIIGTPLYMSPEQADLGNQDVDTRSDVYSLGVVLYELLAGTTPFDADRLRSAGHDEMRRIIREEEPPKPSTRATTMAAATTVESPHDRKQADAHATALKGDLDWIVMKALEKDRRGRYESPAALAADLRRHLDDEPIEAAAPSAMYRARKFLRRHRARIRSLAAATAVLMAAAAFVVFRSIERRQVNDGIAQGVRQRLAAFDAALSSYNVALAQESLDLARGQYAGVLDASPRLAGEIDAAARRIDDYQQDQKQYEKFIATAQGAQVDLYWGVGDQDGGVRINVIRGLTALNVFDDSERLDEFLAMQLSPAQKLQAKDTAYVTLLCLADQLRWDRSAENAQASLRYLRIAESVRTPTRAYYGLSAEAHDALGDHDATKAAQKAAEHAPVEFAWDYFFEAHTARWNGDHQRALDPLMNALRVQPDHFNSLVYLGVTYANDLQDDETAIAYTTGAIAVRPNDVLSYINRSKAFSNLGQFENAAQDLTLALKKEVRADRRLTILEQRAAVYRRLERVDEAQRDEQEIIAFHVEYLNAQRQQYGPEHEETLRAMSNLANVYTNADQFKEAEDLYRAGLATALAALGPRHEQTQRIIRDFARFYNEIEQSEIAERKADVEELHKMHQELFGSDDPDTLNLQNTLAVIDMLQGNLDQAAVRLEELRGRYAATVGLDDPTAATIVTNLADLYLQRMQPEQAAEVLEECWNAFKEAPTKDTEWLKHATRLVGRLGGANEEAENWEAALEFYHQLVELTKSNPRPQPIEIGAAQATLARLQLKREQFADAEPILRECLAVREEHLPDDWSRFNAMSMLGAALAGQEKFAEAEPLLVDGFEGLNRRADTMPPAARVNLQLAIEQLVSFYERTERPDEAKRWREHLPAESTSDP